MILLFAGSPGLSRIRPSKDRMFQGAYPAIEFAGLVFAYMGRPEEKPEFPYYDAFDLPDDQDGAVFADLSLQLAADF